MKIDTLCAMDDKWSTKVISGRVYCTWVQSARKWTILIPLNRLNLKRMDHFCALFEVQRAIPEILQP